MTKVERVVAANDRVELLFAHDAVGRVLGAGCHVLPDL